ncbi:predicted protein, partial [Nematostella vectensis]
KLCVDPVNSIVNQETVFLSGEQIVDKRPEYEFHSSMNGYGDEDSFVPSVMDRYRQLLLPALQVISTILASLGPQHREASMKVLGVVVSHADVFTSILQDRTPVHTPSSLQELALITGIICNAALTETSVLDEDTILEDEIKLRGPLARIQRLMLALLPKYCSSENWDKVIKTVAAQNSPHQGPGSKLSPVAMETAEMLHRICCNVIGYCRTIVSSSGYRAAAAHTHRPPSLGVLVTVIKGCADQMGRAVDVYKQTSLKQQNMAELTGEELRELKQEASSCVTDVLLKKLVDLEQNHGKARSRMSFIQVLVRRVKRLLTLHGIHSLDELGPARKSA